MWPDVYHLLLALCAVGFTGYLLFWTLTQVGARKAVRTGDGVETRGLHGTGVAPEGGWPGVTILKPCAGADDDFEQCLESFASLRYPSVQLVCGVRDMNDAAYPILRKVKDAHPELDMQIVLTGPGRHASPKVSNLEPMAEAAKHGLFWLSDSNTRVHPDTLMGMVDDLLNGKDVGAVVSPIVGDDERSLGATLENVHMTGYVGMCSFASWQGPGIMTAPGKSALLRRETLAAMGSWDELGRYFGEDLILYNRVREGGKHVVLGRHIVTNVNATSTVQRFLVRHMRWMQIRWTTAPMYANLFEPFLTPVSMSTLLAVCAPSSFTLTVLLVAYGLQIVGDQITAFKLRGHVHPWRWAGVIALRPYLVLGLWASSLFNRRVMWRGKAFWMGPQSRILTTPPNTPLRALRNAIR